MQKTCLHCRQSFQITDHDLSIIQKASPVIGEKMFDIPAPTLCPDCRFQRRISFRNERKLYHRKCDLTGKQIISVYAPDGPYKAYEQSAWWSDAYDPLQYGRDVDFNQPFFDQFVELNREVPKLAIQNAKSENSEYTNYSAENKNCYLLVGGLGAEDCLYSYRVFYSKDIVDCYDLIKCERCYECLESSNCFVCVSCHNCQNCSDVWYSENCTGCKNCFGCANLRNKEYHIFNKKFSPEDYKKIVAGLQRKLPADAAKDIKNLHFSVPHRYAQILQCDDVSGDQLLECQRCFDCYTLKHSQDCSHCIIAAGDHDCVDINFGDNCELQYESSNLEKNYRCAFCMLVWYSKDLFYCMNSFNSKNCFGCTGLKKQEFCILNKQYTEDEYNKLVPKIIDHMKKNKEYGQFFPATLSPFAYNETIAQEHFPITEKEAKKHGWPWRNEQPSAENYLGPTPDISVAIDDIADDITKQVLTCSITGKPYRIIPQELKFYREMKLPIPSTCPDQRHAERMARLNPRKLWNRTCSNCKKEIRTTSSPERKEIVYCEDCYLKTVY